MMGTDLIDTLVQKLSSLPQVQETTLLYDVIAACDAVLNLEQEYPDEFTGQNSLVNRFAELRGFEDLEYLCNNENEEIAEKAQQTVRNYNREEKFDDQINENGPSFGNN